MTNHATKALALLVALTGCSRSELVVPGVRSGSVPPIECPAGQTCSVAEDCEGAVIETVQRTLSFEASSGCIWGQGGNLSQQDALVRARHEQILSVDLPAGAVICGMEFELPTTDLRYDDHLLITFDDVILMASLAVTEQGPFVSDNGLSFYAWPDLINHPLDFETFCLGEASGEGACSLPESESFGLMSLELQPLLVQKLGYVAAVQQRVEFSVIVTGDDNPDLDCRHTPFDVIVDLSTATP